jgi:molecular chaperone DnaJ
MGCLSDPRSAPYDRFGRSVGNAGGFHDYTVDFADIFDELLGSSILWRGSSLRSRRGRDLQLSLNSAFEEAVFGAAKEVEFERNDTCSRCKGSGAETGTTPTRCPTCGGHGEVRQVRQTILGQMVQTSACPNCGGRGEVVAHPARPAADRA